MKRYKQYSAVFPAREQSQTVEVILLTNWLNRTRKLLEKILLLCCPEKMYKLYDKQHDPDQAFLMRPQSCLVSSIPYYSRVYYILKQPWENNKQSTSHDYGQSKLSTRNQRWYLCSLGGIWASLRPQDNAAGRTPKSARTARIDHKSRQWCESMS